MLAAEAGEEPMLAAEAGEEPMLAAVAGEGEGKAEVKGKAEGKGKGERSCYFRDCLCDWLYFSSTTRVAPGIDYPCTPAPAAADHHLPAWSLLVGVTDGVSSLQVSRLRVARSGRILGRSDDVLEVFHNIVLANPPRYSFQAGVAPLVPDGLSLCVLHSNLREQPQSLQLTLQPQPDDTRESPLPGIDWTTSQCVPISAGGNIWALSAILQQGQFSVVTRRLVPELGGGRQWEPVGSPFTSPLVRFRFPPWKGGFLQGYAVLPDDKLILVSFLQYGLFLTFDTESCSWTRVLTDTDNNNNNTDTDYNIDYYPDNETRSQEYLPIFGRGIYVEQHKAVCMLRDGTVYAYKLTYQKDDQGTQRLKLDLPVKIDFVCPFIAKKGYGFLTRLAGRLMCSVWISLAWRKPCPCDNLHAIVTTFDLHELAEGGIKVLHSTYRRIEMVPNPRVNQKFCFLQEYEDQGSPVLQQCGEEQKDLLTSSQHVDQPPKMLSCCRYMMEMEQERQSVSLQPEEPSSTIPPLGLSRSLQGDPASRQHQVCSSSPVVPVKPATTTIKKDLFIICQAGSGSVTYQTGAMDDDVKPLNPCHLVDAKDHCWLFFQNGSKIQAVSSTRGGLLEFSLNKDCQTIKLPVRRPTAGPFVMVMRVGRETIALTETLQVYHQTRFNYGSTTTWVRYMTDESDVVPRKVEISGYVALNDDSFMVCDAVTCSCLLFDLVAKQWRVVMPWAALKENVPTTIPENGFFNGRCVFVDGFIYTCRNGGLAAYELLDEDYSVYLSKPIFLPFSSLIHCVGEDMCLDYAGKDVDSDANLFYVVQGEYSPPRHGVITTFSITTVKVKTKRTANNKMKPVGVDQMDSVRRFMHHTEAIVTRCCFAV